MNSKGVRAIENTRRQNKVDIKANGSKDVELLS